MSGQRARPTPEPSRSGGNRTTVVQLQRSVPRGSVIAATVERAGGVDAPTQTPVLRARA